MTLIQLGFASICLCLIVGGGYIGGYAGGWPGAILGAAVGFGSFHLLIRAIALIDLAWHRFCPLRPVCRNGACGASQYKQVELREGSIVYQCECGTKYLHKGAQFLEILPNGTQRPFMRRKTLGKWELESPECCRDMRE